jgi:ribonuclease P protein component
MRIYKDERFHKGYRLCGAQVIQTLMQEPVILKHYPFLLKKSSQADWENLPITATFAQWLFVVPKKRFRRAHVRNGIRRKIRESVRKNQQDLLQHLSATAQWMQFALYYVGPPDCTAAWMEQKVKDMLEKMKTVV